MNRQPEPSEPSSGLKRTIITLATATGLLGVLHNDSVEPTLVSRSSSIEVMNNIPSLIQGMKEYNLRKVITTILEPATLIVREPAVMQEGKRHHVIERFVEENEYAHELESLLLQVINMHFNDITAFSFMGEEIIKSSIQDRLQSVNEVVIQSYTTEYINEDGEWGRIYDHSFKSMEILEHILDTKYGIIIENISVDLTTEDDLAQHAMEQNSTSYKEALLLTPEVEHHVTITATHKGERSEVAIALPIGVIVYFIKYYSKRERSRRSRRISLDKRKKITSKNNIL